MKRNGATFIFIGELGNTFFGASFGPASVSVLSGIIALSPDFWYCGPKLKPLYCCHTKLCGVGVALGGQVWMVLAAVITVLHGIKKSTWKTFKVNLNSSTWVNVGYQTLTSLIIGAFQKLRKRFQIY